METNSKLVRKLKVDLKETRSRLETAQKELVLLSAKTRELEEEEVSLKTKMERLGMHEQATLDSVVRGLVPRKSLDAVRQEVKNTSELLVENKLMLGATRRVAKQLQDSLPNVRGMEESAREAIMTSELEKLKPDTENLSGSIAILWVLHVSGVKLPLVEPYTNLDYMEFLARVFPMKGGNEYKKVEELLYKDLFSELQLQA